MLLLALNINVIHSVRHPPTSYAMPINSASNRDTALGVSTMMSHIILYLLACILDTDFDVQNDIK